MGSPKPSVRPTSTLRKSTARPDSIGKAIPNAEILVVREDGSACDPGEEGELVHRGALVAMGYWNDPERTAARFRPVPGREGAICTTETAVFSGDLVKRDEEGFLYFVGRKDEMIKTSGYRVSPTEIEQVAYATGLVGDAVALGVDDERLGQHIVLAASPADGRLEPDELLEELRQQLPLYMVPQRVVIRTSASPLAQQQARSKSAPRGAGPAMTEVLDDRDAPAWFAKRWAGSRSIASSSGSVRRHSSPTTARC